MPWQEMSIMGERREFVRLAMQAGANRRELCRRFGISPDVGYKWIQRWEAGDEELADRSRRPHRCPGRSEAVMEEHVLAVRDAHPAWGARKIARCLENVGIAPPALSTVHGILCRHSRIKPPITSSGAYQRFEMEAPNLLWQMDFKGWVPLANQARCHPLTIVDDHSRFAVCLAACANEQSNTVQGQLEITFRCYGLPEAVFVDNGTPWGDASGARWTRLGVWLLKLGVDVLHSRPFHPQSRGKSERFHRTLKAEVFTLERLRDLAAAQRAFDRWRIVYNFDRPHEALDQEVPASRYRPSARSMPDRLPTVEYDEHEIVRAVSTTRHYVRFKGRSWICRAPFAASALRFGRVAPMAAMASSSAPAKSLASTFQRSVHVRPEFGFEPSQ
jgi:transposase InsO family protein